MKEAIPWGRRREPGARVKLASSCWERGCSHFLHSASGVDGGTLNSPCEQGHETLYVPTTITAVQRPDAIMREKGGAGCGVVLILVAGFGWNGRKK